MARNSFLSGSMNLVSASQRIVGRSQEDEPLATDSVATTDYDSNDDLVEGHSTNNFRSEDDDTFVKIASSCCRGLSDESGDPRKVWKMLTCVTVVGVVLGSVVPKDLDKFRSSWYPYLSSMIGYTYFAAWSLSFYPQIISNFQRKSTNGLSVDFACLNVLGFAAYAAYNAAFFWSDSIRRQYEFRHDGRPNVVESNDLAFAVHALIMSSVVLFQIAHYDGLFAADAGTSPRRLTTLSVAFATSALVVYAVVVSSTNDENSCAAAAGSPPTRRRSGCWIDFVYALSYLKLVVTFVKYLPQLVLNYRRKSTEGFNIWNIVLDFYGGALSMSQLILDSWNIGDFSAVTGNMVKFMLAWVSITFDVVFFFQHYVFYKEDQSETDSNSLFSLDGVQAHFL